MSDVKAEVDTWQNSKTGHKQKSLLLGVSAAGFTKNQPSPLTCCFSKGVSSSAGNALSSLRVCDLRNRIT